RGTSRPGIGVREAWMLFTRPEFWAKRAMRTAFAAAWPTAVWPRTAARRAAVDSTIAARFFVIVSPSEVRNLLRTLALSSRRLNRTGALSRSKPRGSVGVEKRPAKL